MGSDTFVEPSEAAVSSVDEELDMSWHELLMTRTPPMTLSIPPGSFLIQTAPSSGRATNRALYQITRPLDGHRSNIIIASIPPRAPLRADGRCERVSSKQQLYKIYQETQGSLKATVESSRDKTLIHVALVMRGIGFGKSWEAWNHLPDQDKQSSRLYHVKPNGTSIEWKDATGDVIAVEKPAPNRATDVQELEIQFHLERETTDALVAVWVAKIWLDARVEWLKEEAQEKQKKRAVRRKLAEQHAGDSTEDEPQNAKEDEGESKVEGKPHGRLHNLKTALGKVGFGHSKKANAK